MQTTIVDDKPVEARTPAPRPPTETDEFDSVLTTAQSARMSVVAMSFTDATGLQVASRPQERSARRARVDQETDQARQAETEANRTRRADSTSIQRSAIDSRRERVISQQEATIRGTIDSSAKGGGTGDPSTPAAATASKAQNGRDRLEALSVRDENRGAENRLDENRKQAKAAAPVRLAPPTNPAGASEPSSHVVPVTTAGVSQASRVGSSDIAKASSAQTIGRLLAGGEGIRVLAEGQAMESGRDASLQSRNEGTGKTRSGSNAQSGKTASSDSAQPTSRTEFQKLVSQVRLNAGVRMSSATIRLDPPELGRIRVDVRMMDDALRVRIETATPHAREILLARSSELAAALREHNIDVDRFDVVHVETPNTDESDESSDPKTDERTQAFGDFTEGTSGEKRHDHEDASPEEADDTTPAYEGLEMDKQETQTERERRLDVRI